jgi:glycosyltransferase involved in cell wall biosynthesis
MNYPVISLVTACFNHKDYIATTIESIVSQNYPNLQYVVIDDGSTDGSWEIIQKYKDKLYHCERLEGYRDTVTVALNYGIKKTSGELMGWLNSDDILLPNSLFTIAKIFSDQPEVDWFTGMASTINQRGELVNSNLRLKNKYDYLSGNWQVIQQESTFWRRRLWEKSGGALNEQQKWAFDTELWTKFFALTDHYHAATPVGAFRKGMQSKSINNKSSFLVPNEAHLQKMKDSSSKKDLFLTGFYKWCKRLVRPFMSLVPSRFFYQLPLVKRFTYKVLQYSFESDKWILTYRNPFRKNQ